MENSSDDEGSCSDNYNEEPKDNLTINLNVMHNSDCDGQEDNDYSASNKTSSESPQFEDEDGIANISLNYRSNSHQEDIYSLEEDFGPSLPDYCDGLLIDENFKQEFNKSTDESSSTSKEEGTIGNEISDIDKRLNSKIIKVEVKDEFSTKYLKVAVVNLSQPRQFLGGYKNKFGVVFYNVAAQTEGYRQRNWGILRSRDAQACLPLIDRGVNTGANKSTQATMRDYLIPQVTDVIVSSHPPKSCESELPTMSPSQAAIIIQKFFKRLVILIRNGRQEAENGEANEVLNKQPKRVDFRFNNPKLIFPTDDVSLTEWKKKELQILKEQKSGFAYKAAVVELHTMETKCLLEIEQRRLQRLTKIMELRDSQFLEATSRSIIRRYSKGHMTILDDLNVQRAREFKNMFTQYKRTNVPQIERLAILRNLKNRLLQFAEADLTWDPIELLDREVDFITMGIDEQKMATLRRRFETLFMSIAKNCDVNPQAKKHKHLIFGSEGKCGACRCEGCGKVMNPSQFSVQLTLSRFKLCASCESSKPKYRSYKAS